MNEWEAKYKAICAGITDDRIIKNAEILVSIGISISKNQVLPFSAVMQELLMATTSLSSSHALGIRVLHRALDNDEFHSRLPWRLERDNADGIEIVADDGNLVLIFNYQDIPPETPAGLRQELIQEARANFHLILERINR